ncbi:hypothetical protein [Halomicronema sp. CCY15110]|uniref:hypothetical protein n=1 Tax=Halomicronema sp. CCY15110 TaxID=2767773 RepID=UPI00194EDE21|nr:hypothetical protein [Halomicronema sp. CCY15110]
MDIDAGSAYHPSRAPLAIGRLIEALEPLGLVSAITCTSSDSRGLHLYFPFETPQNSWQLSAAVTVLLENQGFKCQPGQLEVFPNRKLYVADSTPNLFNAHRLPLQSGSYLLNGELEPTLSTQETFVQQWRCCQQRNEVQAATVQQVLKQSRRKQHRLSRRADQFLNDLNAEIEPGWTGKGQTNYLLGRITMRAYVFHHVIHGGLPLSGDTLISEIVTVAQSLPGYREWCGHQHEIHHRAAEWARCVENSHYFPYGAQHGKYKAQKETTKQNEVEMTWNEQRSLTAQDKIRAAMQDLLNTHELPATATARFHKLLNYGIGGSTLYKYKDLWHPDLWKSSQTPQPLNEREASAMAAPATASYATSLLPGDDRNSLPGKGLTLSGETFEGLEVRNEMGQAGWRQQFLRLKVRRSQQKSEVRSQSVAYQQSTARQNRQRHLEKKVDYLRSGDPILIREGLQWLSRQRDLSLQALLPEIFRRSVPSGDWQQPLLAEWAIFNQEAARQGCRHGLSWLAEEVLTGVEQSDRNGKVELDAR